MLVVYNLMLIALVGLIAYWWANQGLFSSMLHMLCVIVAGLVALAFWEPLSFALIAGNKTDDYIWGVTLVLVFCLTLFLLRLAMDKLAPANVNVPQWANLSFGGAFGFVSGTIAIGFFIIGSGHIQSTNKIMGYRGYSRTATGEIRNISGLWLPFHKWTDEFYSLLSVSSMRSAQPLRQYAPDLYRQASLLRDSYEGVGKLSLAPEYAQVERVERYSDGGRLTFYTRVKFELGAIDFGEQLTLSKSQIRLIGQTSSRGKPEVIHPEAWRQHSGIHLFDNVSHYATSRSGRESAELTFAFNAPADFSPRFLQIRGTRYAITRIEDTQRPMVASRNNDTDPGTFVAGEDITSAITVSNSIRPIMASTNTMPGSITERDKYLTEGKATFPRRGSIGARSLRIQGIYEPDGTRCVMVDVSRDSPANIYRFIDSGAADQESTIALVDIHGETYSPVGYFYDQPGEGITIRLEPATRIRSVEDDMMMPTSGDHKIKLIFYVPINEIITGLRIGDNSVGSCSVTVEPERD